MLSEEKQIYKQIYAQCDPTQKKSKNYAKRKTGIGTPHVHSVHLIVDNFYFYIYFSSSLINFK